MDHDGDGHFDQRGSLGDGGGGVAPKPGTLEATIAACQNAQHQHYLLAGKTQKEREEDRDAAVPYRVYEGVPNFVFQECMEEKLTQE